MSVHGEFRRCLRNCADALRDALPAGAEPWRDAFAEAAMLARADLTRAAQRMLALEQCASPPPRFEHGVEAERFAGLFEHLCELCSAISGESREPQARRAR